MDLSWHLADGTGLDRQHRPAMAFGDHGVLQNRAKPPEHLLQLVSTLLTKPMPLLAKTGERSTGPVGNTTAFLESELQSLLKLRQRHHPFDQSRANRTQVRLIDLPAQAPRCGEGFSHPQELFPRCDTSFTAAQQHWTQIHHTAKTQSPFTEVIKNHHLHGFGESLAARSE